jgi:dolichol kinase
MGEIKRQFIHSLGVLTIVPLVYLGKSLTSIFVASIVCFLVFWSFYRRSNRFGTGRLWYEKFERFIRDYERHHETHGIPLRGAITFFVGALITIALFPEGFAVAAIAVLAIGDSVSTLIGTEFGKHKLFFNRKKSWEGSLAFFIVSLLILMFFVDPLKALIYSLIVTGVEGLPKIDDNLTIPIAVGLLLTFV